MGYVNYLHQLADGCTDVVFTGAVYGEEKEALLRNAYTFCIPSTIEGLSISLLEAMSYSLPIIASDINANKEVLEADKALWVRPENEEDLIDAIEKAWKIHVVLFSHWNIITIMSRIITHGK